MEDKIIPATDAVIRVRDLKKDFGRLSVLKGIDVDIRKGDVVCVIGASGSGKSTFLRCLNLLEMPAAAASNLTASISPAPRWIWICTGRRWAWCSSSSICSPI